MKSYIIVTDEIGVYVSDYTKYAICSEDLDGQIRIFDIFFGLGNVMFWTMDESGLPLIHFGHG